MKTTRYIIRTRPYIGTTTPPSVIEDTSRYRQSGGYSSFPTWTKLPSGLWVNYYSSDSWNITTSPSMKNLASVTTEFWLKTDRTTAAYDGIFDFGREVSPYGDDMYIHYSTKRLRYSCRSAGDNQYKEINTYTTGKWEYWVFIYDGTEIRIYQNGADLGSPVAMTGTLVCSPATSYVGKNTLHSWCADVYIWGFNRYRGVLSDDEIYNRYQKTRGWFGV